MSRDPEDGDADNPKTLHKYLNAGGDPINGSDPTGRAALIQTVLVNVQSFFRTIIFTKEFACTTDGFLVAFLTIAAGYEGKIGNNDLSNNLWIADGVAALLLPACALPWE